MGAAIITNAGKSYLAAKQVAGVPAVLNQFVFALVPGLVTSSTPPGTEVLPAAGYIQHTCAVTRAGFVTPDQCVYSVLVDSSVGDWSYNWIGLKADDGTLAAVVYVPESTKEKYDSLAGHIGNNLTRNFLLQYDNLQTITAITVIAETWQIDFTQRLDASDAMQETLAKALVGNGALFLGNALKIENASGYKMRAGRSIIGGHIVELTVDADASAAGAAASKHIWVDIWRSGDVNGVVVHAGIVPDISTAMHNNYTDSNGIAHTVVKIASISAGGVVTDLRGTNGVLFTSNAAFDEFSKIGHTHTPAQVGLGNLPNAKSDVAADNSNILATIKCVFDAVNAAALSAVNNLAAHIANVGNPHATTKAQVGLGSLPNAKSDSTTLNDSDSLATSAAVYAVAQSLVNKLVPAGMVQPFAGSAAPAGWLKANGGAINRTTYAALFAAIGTTYGAGDGSTTFNLPDLRGEFVRGFDDGRSIDAGRVFGSTQTDAIKAHAHDVSVKQTSQGVGGGSGAGVSNTITSISTTSTGTTETRPRNIAMLYCIKT